MLTARNLDFNLDFLTTMDKTRKSKTQNNGLKIVARIYSLIYVMCSLELFIDFEVRSLRFVS